MTFLPGASGPAIFLLSAPPAGAARSSLSPIVRLLVTTTSTLAGAGFFGLALSGAAAGAAPAASPAGAAVCAVAALVAKSAPVNNPKNTHQILPFALMPHPPFGAHFL